MELRLLLDGGVPPGAPPGKIEPSPGDFQFEDELTTEAQKLAIEEEKGCEPNVPPTNLDPESEQTETVDSDPTAAQSPLSILIGQHILGRPEPSPIQNFVQNKQIAAARIDGNLNVVVNTPEGRPDFRLDQPITLPPNPELAEKFEVWAKEFLTRQTPVDESEVLSLVGSEAPVQQFDPEHLAALNVVFMSKRQVASEPSVVVNPHVLANVQVTDAAEISVPVVQPVAGQAKAITELPELAVITPTSTEAEASQPVQQEGQKQVAHVKPEEATKFVVVQSTSTVTKLGEPKLVEHSEQPAAVTSVDPTKATAVVASTEKSSDSGLASKDGRSETLFDDELTEEQSKLETPTPGRSAIGIPQEDKPTVSQVREPAQRESMTLADRQRNIDVITRKIEALAVNSVRNEIRVEMHPPDMGSVSINVKQAIDSLSVTLTASNDQVQEALKESRNDLAASLQVKAKQEVNIEIKAGQSQSLPQEQANAHHQRNPQREQPEARQQTFSAPTREQKQPTPQAPRVRPNTFINLEI